MRNAPVNTWFCTVNLPGLYMLYSCIGKSSREFRDEVCRSQYMMSLCLHPRNDVQPFYDGELLFVFYFLLIVGI